MVITNKNWSSLITIVNIQQGETGLAVATLQRLGEDVETSLKQLLFGTMRRSLRVQIFEEMKRYGYLGSHEWEIMDRISLVEVCKLYESHILQFLAV